MARLVWFDTDLLTDKDPHLREEIFRGIMMRCGWRNGSLMAEIPRLSSIKRMASEHVPDGLSMGRLHAVLERIAKGRLSLLIPGLEGDSHEARAKGTPLVSYLLTRDGSKIEANPRFRDVEDYLLEPPPMKTRNAWNDPELERSIDLLIIGSRQVDLVDQYLPLDRRNPILQHLTQKFDRRGEFHRHLTGRPQLRLHCAERFQGQIQDGATVSSVLEQMKVPTLAEAFDVSLCLWPQKALHSRFILGDIGGLMLGESLNMPGPVNVTVIQDHSEMRHSLDAGLLSGEFAVRIIPQPRTSLSS
jgi:hypothetical protein